MSSAHHPETPRASLDAIAAAPASSMLERPLPRMSRTMLLGLAYAVGAAVLGVVAGTIWVGVVHLPAWRVAEGGSASLTERDLAAFFTTDFWFSVIGLAGGLVLGGVAWWWFQRRSWEVVLLALACSVVAALLCWWVGESMGPRGFEERLAAARPGDFVTIDFQLTARSALAMWPLGAMLPVMLGSAFLPDADDRALRRLRRAQRARLRSGEHLHQGEQQRSDHERGQQVGDAHLHRVQQPQPQPEQHHPTDH